MTDNLSNHGARRPERVGSLWAGVAASIIVSLGLALNAAHPDSPVMVAVFPPWWDAASAFTAAASAGEPLGTGALPTMVVVRGDENRLAVQLHEAGALFVLTSRFFAGCGRAVEIKS